MTPSSFLFRAFTTFTPSLSLNLLHIKCRKVQSSLIITGIYLCMNNSYCMHCLYNHAKLILNFKQEHNSCSWKSLFLPYFCTESQTTQLCTVQRILNPISVSCYTHFCLSACNLMLELIDFMFFYTYFILNMQAFFSHLCACSEM